MNFTFRPAKREATPLLIGLTAPSGGGKTKSALRLAEGIKRIRGGNIVGIDTEARRMLHYAGEHEFLYTELSAPFSSDRYGEVLKEAAYASEGGVVIIDSMSHEHNGQGGYLEFHEAELDRMAGTDHKKRERVNMLAWVKPAAARSRLINTILQLNCAFIFCFRAKEKIKVVAGKEPIQLGWQPIAGEEFAFEMTVRCLLLPGAEGVPDWSGDAFKNLAAKRPANIAHLLPDGAQITEDLGQKLAEWAAGMPSLEQMVADLIAADTLEKLQDLFGKYYKKREIRPQITEVYNKRKTELTDKK